MKRVVDQFNPGGTLPKHPQTKRASSYVAVTTIQKLRYQLLMYLGVGTVVWLLLYRAYFLLLLFGSFWLGMIDSRSSHLRAGFMLVAPALVLAWWTTPKGDNDGLWVLIFPELLVMIFLTCAGHWLGSLSVRRNLRY